MAERSKARVCGHHLLGLRVRIPPGAWMLVVCCQVEVSATGRSLVQRSPTDCDVSLCVIKGNNLSTPNLVRYRHV